ncbi:MAG: PaaI family thioesterase [Thermaerobacter sp.]|nr:PaaI family thioesterase [Thermaerobacter sp.]
MEILNWPNNTCLVCGPEVAGGLRAVFAGGPDGVVANLVLPEFWQGFAGVAHGGVLAGLVDDAMWHAIYHFRALSTVTAELTVRFHHPVAIGHPLVVRGRVSRFDRRLIRAEASIAENERVLVSATGRFMPGDPVRHHQ